MPHFPDAYVCLASMMQRYGFFLKYARKNPIILTFNFQFSILNLYRGYPLTQLPTYDICILEKLEPEILLYIIK